MINEGIGERENDEGRELEGYDDDKAKIDNEWIEFFLDEK